MLRSAIVAIIGFVGLTQVGLAAQPITSTPRSVWTKVFVKFSKPDTGYMAFIYDRNDCVEAATTQVREKVWLTGIRIRYNLPKLVECMTAKGYSADPNGHIAVVYTVDSEGRIWGVPSDLWYQPL